MQALKSATNLLKFRVFLSVKLLNRFSPKRIIKVVIYRRAGFAVCSPLSSQSRTLYLHMATISTISETYLRNKSLAYRRKAFRNRVKVFGQESRSTVIFSVQIPYRNSHMIKLLYTHCNFINQKHKI